MQILRLSRCLRAAGLALVIAALWTTQASAALVLSGNTHPLDTAPPPNTISTNGVVAFAVYQSVGGTYGNATIDAFVATGMTGSAGSYAYIFDLKNLGTTGINTWGVGIDPTAVTSFGGATGTFNGILNPVFTNMFSPAGPGSATDPINITGVTPILAAGGQVPSPNTPNGGVAFLGLSLQMNFAPSPFGNGILAPGATSVLLGYTSNIAPTNLTGTSINAGASSATGTIPLASPVPEPATVAMLATAIPFGILYLKRRKAASTV